VGPWPVGLDWRAGAPAWRSTLILSRMFYRMCDMLQPRFDEIFQLRVVPLDEDGVPDDERAFYYFPAVNLDDPEEARLWLSAA
jgi:hypothetical protein